MKPLLRVCLGRVAGALYAKNNKVSGPELTTEDSTTESCLWTTTRQ